MPLCFWYRPWQPGSLLKPGNRLAEIMSASKRYAMDATTLTLDSAPDELQLAIAEFWPSSEWDNAARIAYLESGWNWDAEYDSTTEARPCGSVVNYRNGVRITAEHSIGYFQINACNYPGWNAGHLFNARQNAGTAHALWVERGWAPWYFSAERLNLLGG